MAEVIWEGKYREVDGQRVRVEPARDALALRTVERVGASAKGWQNRLIRGDKRHVLPSLLPEFAGQVDLVYVDPPFDTGGHFAFKTRLSGRRAAMATDPAVAATATASEVNVSSIE